MTITTYKPALKTQRTVIFHAHLPERVRMAERLAAKGEHVVLHSTANIPGVSALTRNVKVQVRFGSAHGLAQMADRIIF